MIDTMSKFGVALLRTLPPEQAHEAALKALELGLVAGERGTDERCLETQVWGHRLDNPIAIAAGFDKDARVPAAVMKVGCGFAEVGTITPEPQPGNPKPRLFRLEEDHGVINRLGFNNGGHAAALARLERQRVRGMIGVNIGANKNSTDRTADYVTGLQTFYGVASYFTVNISSPNTPGLRDLQAPAALDELLGRLMDAREDFVAQGKSKIPIVVKIAPDIAEDDVPPIVGRLVARGVDGIAVSNTTLSRMNLKSARAGEAGGLSGRPLFHRSTVLLARVYEETGGRIPLIGIGGIDSGARALEKIEAGATLLQLYTALIYGGVDLISRIKLDLARACRDKGVARLQDLTGSNVRAWARQSFEG